MLNDNSQKGLNTLIKEKLSIIWELNLRKWINTLCCFINHLILSQY